MEFLRCHDGSQRTLFVVLAILIAQGVLVIAQSPPADGGQTSGAEECPKVLIGCTPQSACTPTSDVQHMRALAEYQGKLTVVCAAAGNPRPRVSWESARPQQLHAITAGDVSVLLLERIQSDIHNTTYRCRAVNSCGTGVAHLDVLVAGAPPRSEAAKPVVSRYVKESAILSCSVSGDPTPVITWTNALQDNVVNGNRFTLLSNGSLLVSDLGMQDNGVYFCNAKNQHGQSSASVTLRVRVVPTVTVGFKDEARLECAVSGTPLPFITWHRVVDKRISKTVVGEGSVLNFESARKGDTGEYVCVAANDEGSRLARLRLVVTGESPTSSAKPQSVMNVAAGERVVMSCGNVRGTPEPTVVWRSQVSTPDVSLSTRSQRSGSDLVFPEVQHADRGQYICTITNKLGALQVTITLNVFDGHVTGSDIMPALVFSGLEAVLSCSASSPTQQRLTYSWTWRGLHHSGADPNRPLPAGSIVDRQGKLRIPKTSLDHTGVYTCTAEDRVAVPSVKSGTLAVYGYPKVFLQNASTVFASSGDTIRIPCYVAGYPTPHVTWLNRRQRPVGEGKQVGSTLVLENFSSSQRGQYTCVATNKIRETRAARASVTVLLAGSSLRLFGNSYAAYAAIPASFISFTMSFSFKTSETGRHQLLAINRQLGQNAGKGDFVAIFISDGKVHAMINAGHGSITLTHPMAVVGEAWQDVEFSKDHRDVSLRLNSAAVIRSALPGTLYGLNIDAPLYFGGHPDIATLKELSGTGVTAGFVGCIRNAILSRRSLDLSKKALFSQNTGQCATFCENVDCQNGGACMPSVPRHMSGPNSTGRCRCRSPYQGSKCEVRLDEHHFCTLTGANCRSSACGLSQDCIRPSP